MTAANVTCEAGLKRDLKEEMAVYRTSCQLRGFQLVSKLVAKKFAFGRKCIFCVCVPLRRSLYLGSLLLSVMCCVHIKAAQRSWPTARPMCRRPSFFE